MPMQPDGRSVRVSAPLTNISVAYAQTGRWVADRVFPTVPVNRQGDLYWKYDKSHWFRSVAGVRAPATESAGGGWSVSTDSYYAHVYAVHKDVDDQTRANARGTFDLDRDAARWVTEQLLIKRDRLWVSTYMANSVWTGSTGVGGGSNGADIVGAATAGSNQVVQWDRSGSDPINDVMTQRIGMAERTGKLPNTLVIGPAVYRALLNNSSIIERIKYSERGFPSEDIIAQAFGVDRIIVTWTVENTAAEGAAADPTISFMSNKTALLVYAAPQPSLMEASGGYIFAWTGLLGASALGSRIKRFRMEAIESDRIEGEMAFDMKVVAPDVGAYFRSIVQ